MKMLLTKIAMVCVVAAVCGGIAGLFFSTIFYGLVPRYLLADVLASDTKAAMHLRCWAAFAVGAIFGAIWSYRVIKDMAL